MRPSLAIVLLAAAFLAGGCADDTYQLNYDPRAPLRVAVLPFTETQAGDTFTSVPFAAVVDVLPIIGRSDDRGPATILRWRFLARARDTQMEIVDPSYVDSILLERGIYENAAFLKVDPKDLGKTLGADAVLYGEVTKWDRTYAVVESVTTVGLKIAMHESQTGTLLWEAQCEATDAAGLTGGPTGYTSAALEPVRGLSGETLYKLADEVCRKIVEPHLFGGEDVEHSTPPFIAASAHSAKGPDSMRAGSEFHVVAIGSPDCKASFSIGPFRESVPMTEFGDGTYVGTYVVQPGDRFDANEIKIELVGPDGGVTVQRLKGAKIEFAPE
ncbi:MAG: DUF799 family lipoprotein [Planctomycetes bacterium]|nr:DUF799 family lipoprotein [Planctomycetota bacterium]